MIARDRVNACEPHAHSEGKIRSLEVARDIREDDDAVDFEGIINEVEDNLQARTIYAGPRGFDHQDEVPGRHEC